MLRLETETGYWLVTHQDHARLAGDFAAQWGNEVFLPPEPRSHALRGIACHDDGWVSRDAQPQITRQGKPSAFSVELVGKYSAFEEIDLPDYLAVRERAVRLVADVDPYAALLVSMHTFDLLSSRADRSTIRADQLPLLDAFLSRQKETQKELLAQLRRDGDLSLKEMEPQSIERNFRLLQACDNLSLLGCVDYRQPANLIHALPLRNGGESRVTVKHVADRHFVLEPYPFAQDTLVFHVPARYVEGKLFSSAQELQARYGQAAPVKLQVTVSR